MGNLKEYLNSLSLINYNYIQSRGSTLETRSWSPKVQKQQVCSRPVKHRLPHKYLNIFSKTTCSLNINNSKTDDEWNMRIVTSVRVNTRGLAIQPPQYFQIFHRGPGITGNKRPIYDSVSPSKQLHLFLRLQRWKVIHSIHARSLSCRAGTPGLKEGLAARPAAASKSFTQTDRQIPSHAPSSTWPLRPFEKWFGSMSRLDEWHSSDTCPILIPKCCDTTCACSEKTNSILHCQSQSQASICSKLLGWQLLGWQLLCHHWCLSEAQTSLFPCLDFELW